MLAIGRRVTNAYRQQSKQELLQQQQQLNEDFAQQANSMEQRHNQDLYDLRTQNDAIRQQISRSGGPRIGFGTAVNSGTTGTSINLTTTIGSQNPVRSSVEIHSFDSGRVRNQPQSTEQTKVPQVPLPPINTSQYETIDTPRSNAHVQIFDELGNELQLEPMEDSARTRFLSTREVLGRQQHSVLGDFETTSVFNYEVPVYESVSEKTVLRSKNFRPLLSKKPDMEIDLQETIVNKLLIGAGHMFVESSQGVIQLAMQGGKLIGVVEQETLDAYNNKICAERNLYSSTPVANSTASKVGEFAGGLLLFSVIPGGVAARGYKLALSGAASGATVDTQLVSQQLLMH